MADLLGPDEVAKLAGRARGQSPNGPAWPSGTWGRGTGQLIGVAIAALDGPRRVHIDPTALPAGRRPGPRRLAGRSGAYPRSCTTPRARCTRFAARGLDPGRPDRDTALAAYLALPGQRTFDLADLVLRYLGRELRDDAGARGRPAHPGRASVEDDEEDAAAAGLVLRAPAPPPTWRTRWTRTWTAARGRQGVLRELELPLVSVLAKMEHTGIAADLDHFAAMSATLHGEVKAAEQAAFAVVGHEFNLGSPKQLQEILFNERSLPKTKRIKTGYTTDSEALTSLLAQTGDPLLEHLLRHRDVSKLMTIVDSLIPMPGEDGRIHTTFNQTIAATGRLSSTDPNLQNIPIRSELGRQIRKGFIVGEGYECLLTADYSQIELRIMAHLSGDEALIAAVRAPDTTSTPPPASLVFGLPPEEVEARAAGQDQGDELRPGVRPGPRLRLSQPAAHYPGRGPRA